MQRTSKWIAGSFLAASLVAGYTGSTAIADGGDDHGQHKAEGESHAHASPHGGVIKTVGEFHVEFVAKDYSQDDVWTCSMNAQIREPAAGKCPKCSMTMIPAKDGATQIELYIYGGTESEAHPIEAKPLAAYLKVPDQDGFTALTLAPAPLEGEGDDATSHFTALGVPQLTETGFTATLRIPIEDETYRVMFETEASSHDEHADEDDGHGHGHDDNDKDHDTDDGHGHKDQHDDKHDEKPDHPGH